MLSRGAVDASLVFTPVPERGFSRAELGRLALIYGAIAALHLAGWGLYLAYAAQHSALVGLGFAAYMLGLRHAFDADHIAAVDDTVRLMVQRGEQPLAVGFFFSLGHSTVVFVAALGVIVAASSATALFPGLERAGATIGAGVSGAFLWFVGLLNLVVLLDVLKVWRRARSGAHEHAHIEQLLARRGLINRLLGGRVSGLVRSSHHMYPVGLLFGLGFDTASEVALLVLAAGAASASLPAPALLALPLLFTAGMTLMDTTDGVLMVKAYRWAFVNPLRKILYNITTTSISVAVALVIGTIQLLSVASDLGWQGALAAWAAGVDLGGFGFVIVGLLLLAWAVSVALWRRRGRVEPAVLLDHVHEHTHADGTRHAHEHFH